MEIVIEDASVRFLDEFYSIEKECFDHEAFSKRQIGYLLTDYNSVSLLARVNGEIAGFIIGRIDGERDSIVGHILTIDVARLCRRMGIATQLLMRVEEIFKDKGVKECRLEVREDNAVAIGLYIKLGYRRVARLDNYYRDAHGLYFRKLL
jgi:ribosomal-protein-alanine N-acetyltransferase